MNSPIYNGWVEEERKDIESIDDFALLSRLFSKTIKLISIEEFEELINKVNKVRG